MSAYWSAWVRDQTMFRHRKSMTMFECPVKQPQKIWFLAQLLEDPQPLTYLPSKVSFSIFFFKIWFVKQQMKEACGNQTSFRSLSRPLWLSWLLHLFPLYHLVSFKVFNSSSHDKTMVSNLTCLCLSTTQLSLTLNPSNQKIRGLRFASFVALTCTCTDIPYISRFCFCSTFWTLLCFVQGAWEPTKVVSEYGTQCNSRGNWSSGDQNLSKNGPATLAMALNSSLYFVDDKDSSTLLLLITVHWF